MLRYVVLSIFFSTPLNFTLFTLGISELSNECGKSVVIDIYISWPLVTSKPLI